MEEETFEHFLLRNGIEKDSDFYNVCMNEIKKVKEKVINMFIRELGESPFDYNEPLQMAIDRIIIELNKPNKEK